MTDFSNLTVSNMLYLGNTWNEIRIDTESGPFHTLHVHRAITPRGNLAVFGPIGTVTDPTKMTGGGTLVIGHGWTASNDSGAIVLTDWPIGAGYDTLWVKYSPGFPGTVPLQNLDWGNIALGTITSHRNQGEGWQNWNIVLDIQNYSDGAIHCATGNLLFDLSWDGNFYWVSTDVGYTMSLDHWGNLWLRGGLYAYDDYDDLAVIKSITTTNKTENGKTKKIIDLKSLSLVNPESNLRNRIADAELTNYYDVGKVQGFTLSCLKNLALQFDAYDMDYDTLLTRIESLENQLKGRDVPA